jgi:predicted metal-dependent hydrolase
VQLQFLFNSLRRPAVPDCLTVGGRRVSLAIVRNPRARRYILRVTPDASARLTIPRGGSIAGGHRFVSRQIPWLERQLHRLASRPRRPVVWTLGTEILFRGELVKIESHASQPGPAVRLGDEILNVADPSVDLRPEMERHLWNLAGRELPPRVHDCAALHQLAIRRVTVRNQRSRWGSCSRHGVISLNWRLIQTPPSVCDYIIAHELMHLRQMNHSPRFWREVERACPHFADAERWLKAHSDLIS